MKKRLWVTFPTICLALALLLLLSVFISARTFFVTKYRIYAPLEQPLRLVQLSDLHNQTFGKDNVRLIERVRALEPDLILMTGDMINSDDPDISVILELTESLSEIAPVYCCYGNHETSWMKHFDTDLRSFLEQAGATVLNVEYCDVCCKGNELRLGGYEGYYRASLMTSGGDKEREEREDLFFADFEDTDRYKILLNHIPTAWLDWEYRDEYDVDLVFCGHYHGGQVRLPLIGGLIAPNIGYFPHYTKGLYASIPAKVVLSAGLGSDRKIPRINNPGEIVCVDLLPEK